MSPQDRARYDRMAAELAEMRRDTRLVPARWPSNPATVYLVIPQQGNLIQTVNASNFYGLKYPTADVTSVPTLTPTATVGGCPDGLSEALLVSNSGSTSVVWIGTRLKPVPANPVVQEMLGSFYFGTPVLCRTIVHMPIGAGPSTAPVYVPWRM